jgi:cardiolipin synthase A/B
MLELALSVVIFAAAVVASGHAVIYKREPRAAALWIVVIWLVPAAGPVLYVLLGFNRVRRQAVAMRGDMVHHRTIPYVMSVNSPAKETSVTHEPEQFRLFARLVKQVSSRPLLPGNSLVPLVNGAEAYPAMLEAIESATESIGLATYIFDGAGAGERFVEALVRSKQRGVEIRVLIDAVGANYSWPPVSRSLRGHGIDVALFNPRIVPQWLPAVNLRNHRKILVVDGKVGFTGGLISSENTGTPNLKRLRFGICTFAYPVRWWLIFAKSSQMIGSSRPGKRFVVKSGFRRSRSAMECSPEASRPDQTKTLNDCAGSLSVR